MKFSKFVLLFWTGFFLINSPSFAETEMEKVLRKALLGDASAQYRIGTYFRYGETLVLPDGSRLKQDQSAAKEWFLKAAKQGDQTAQLALGDMYYEGKGLDGEGIPGDRIEATKWYKSALNKMDEQIDGSKNNFERTFWIETYSEITYKIGEMYFQECPMHYLSLFCGRHDERYDDEIFPFPQDYDQAREWFYKAAIKGHAKAQHELGRIYAEGWNVPQNYEQAAKWYQEAWESGYDAASLSLGDLFITMDDKLAAHTWLNIASSVRGISKLAIEKREMIALTMTTEQIVKAQAMATELFQRRKTNVE